VIKIREFFDDNPIFPDSTFLGCEAFFDIGGGEFATYLAENADFLKKALQIKSPNYCVITLVL
jgi:hypothetical protein